MDRLFPLTSSAGQRATRRRSKSRAGGTLTNEIIATVTRLDFYRPCPWLGSVRLPLRTEWRRGEETRGTHPTNQKHIESRAAGQTDQRVSCIEAKRRDYYDVLMRRCYTRVVVYVHRSVRYNKWMACGDACCAHVNTNTRSRNLRLRPCWVSLQLHHTLASSSCSVHTLQDSNHTWETSDKADFWYLRLINTDNHHRFFQFSLKPRPK